jgi:hypothetical protein
LKGNRKKKISNRSIKKESNRNATPYLKLRFAVSEATLLIKINKHNKAIMRRKTESPTGVSA